MVTFNLDTFLSGHAFGFALIFCRIGSIMMLLPGLAESYVPVRVRLLFAFSVCFLLMGPLLPRLPAAPERIPELVRMLGCEIVVGLFFGTFLRILLSSLEAAGTVIGVQSGLSNATVLNPALGQQSPLSSALLSTAGITLIFVTGLDHMLLKSFAAIYDVFPAGDYPVTGDMAQSIIKVTNKSFSIGIEIAMPFFVIGLLMYSALGIIQKLMPQVQLFLVALPLQIWGSLLLLGITVAGTMTVWLYYFDNSVGTFLQR